VKLSQIIREYVDLKVEGAPKFSEWISIDAMSERRSEYHNKLEELEEAIDAAIGATPSPPSVTGGTGGK